MQSPDLEGDPFLSGEQSALSVGGGARHCPVVRVLLTPTRAHLSRGIPAGDW